MSWELVKRHYSRAEVRRELSEYCKGRWVAIHCEKKDSRGLQLMIRYRRGKRKPLTLCDEADLTRILEEYSELRPRAFYATAHIYRRLESASDVMDQENIVMSAPAWDIDSKDGDWRKVVKKALDIVEVLESYGVVKSVFFKWSGRGAHIHINPKAFSREILSKIDPLDIAYSITQYVINRIEPEEGVAVENKIDVQRVFTAPLSLHRSVNRVAVCAKPEELENFHISWADPDSYKHSPESWRAFEEGEGDEIAERAYTAIGPYTIGKLRRKRKHKPIDQEIMEALRRLDL